MRIGLLGELELLDDEGNDVPVAGAKLRALLAVLALHVGRVVPADQLIEALWGEDPPAAVRNGLQGLVSKLRRALGASDLVTMRGDGYALELPTEAIDVARFEQRAAAGRRKAAAGELAAAVDLLAEADSLWRGDPLADFVYEDFAAGAVTRLFESRLALVEERLDVELRLGRHHSIERPGSTAARWRSPGPSRRTSARASQYRVRAASGGESMDSSRSSAAVSAVGGALISSRRGPGPRSSGAFAVRSAVAAPRPPSRSGSPAGGRRRAAGPLR